MEFKKGMKLFFPTTQRTELIVKGSKDLVSGMIKTDSKEYSCDFVLRWLNFGFAQLIDKQRNVIEYKKSPFFY